MDPHREACSDIVALGILVVLAPLAVPGLTQAM
jgi:hypothetical protein